MTENFEKKILGYRKHPEKSFDVLEKNKNFENRLQNAVLKTALKDNRQENVYTNKVDASPVFGDIIFSLCTNPKAEQQLHTIML